MRVALGFGAVALVVGVFAIRKRYDAHVVEAKETMNNLRNREIPQTTAEGESASADLADGYQVMHAWITSPVINQIINPPPSLDIISQLPSVESDGSDESGESDSDSKKSDEK